MGPRYASKLAANLASVSEPDVKHAYVSELDANRASVSELDVNHAYVSEVEVNQAYESELEVNHAYVAELGGTDANVSSVRKTQTNRLGPVLLPSNSCRAHSGGDQKCGLGTFVDRKVKHLAHGH